MDICKNPVLYDLFVLSGSSKVPVPVRIMNTIRGARRPNLNVAEDGEDYVDDFLVRRFFMCDAAMGREGTTAEDYLSQKRPNFIRWAAHMLIQFRGKQNGDGKIWQSRTNCSCRPLSYFKKSSSCSIFEIDF